MRSKALSKRRPSIDKSELAFGLDQKWEDESYLKSMEHARCVVSMNLATDDCSVVGAHLRIGFHASGMRPHDFHCLPLSVWEHNKQVYGEGKYWTEACAESPPLLYQFIKGYATLRYIKHMLGGDMSDREVVKRVKEMVG